MSFESHPSVAIHPQGQRQERMQNPDESALTPEGEARLRVATQPEELSKMTKSLRAFALRRIGPRTNQNVSSTRVKTISHSPLECLPCGRAASGDQYLSLDVCPSRGSKRGSSFDLEVGSISRNETAASHTSVSSGEVDRCVDASIRHMDSRRDMDMRRGQANSARFRANQVGDKFDGPLIVKRSNLVRRYSKDCLSHGCVNSSASRTRARLSRRPSRNALTFDRTLRGQFPSGRTAFPARLLCHAW